MEKDTTYNGWTNYATWKVNLEIFEEIDLIYDYCEQHYQQCGQLPTVHHIREYLEQFIEEILDSEINTDFLYSCAHSFLMQVNYYEIAKTHYEDIIEREEIKELIQTESA